MATYSKVKFSNSTDGMGVLITGTSVTGTLIHTADASALDEIYLWAENLQTGTPIKLTVEWGTPAPQNNIEINVAPKSGLLLVVPGMILTNSKTLRAFCGVSNAIMVHRFVNRITS